MSEFTRKYTCPHCNGEGQVTWAGELARSLGETFMLLFVIVLMIGIVFPSAAGVKTIEVKVTSDPIEDAQQNGASDDE